MLKKRLGIEAVEKDWFRQKYVYDYFKVSSSLTIPEGCRKIGENAFWKCRIIKEAVIPEGVRKISVNAFAWCSKLKEIEIPGSVERIDDWAFFSCIELEEVAIPESVVWIGDYAFGRCKKATIIIRKPWIEFESIGIDAFSGCNSVEYVEEEVRN